MSAPAAAAPAAERSMAPVHVAFMLFIQALWGGNIILSKFALEEVPPFAFTGARFAILFLLLVPFMKWHREQFGLILIIALGSGVGAFGLMFFALSIAREVAPLAVAMQLGVPFATILSVVFLGERIGVWRVSALVLAFAGILIMGFDARLVEDLPALGLVALGALSFAIGTLAMRRVRGVGTFDMQGWMALISFPILLAVSFLAEPGHVLNFSGSGWAGWGVLAYTIILSSLIGHAGIFYVIQRYSIPQAAPFLLLAPVLGAIFGVIILGDTLTWRLVVGGLLTFAGVLLITLREGRQRTGAVPA